MYSTTAHHRWLPICLLLILAGGLDAATTILAATDLGPVRSTDGGLTWSILPVNVNGGLLSGQPAIHTVAVDPRTPSTWYVSGSAGGSFGLYRSTDSGQTWSGTPFLNFQPSAVAGSIVFDAVTTSTMYMIASTVSAHNFIVRSTDSGATWTKMKLPATVSFPAVSFPDGASVEDVTTDPRIAGMVYAVAAHYVFKSIDFGATWAVLSTGVDRPEQNNQAAGAFPSLIRIEIDPRFNTTLYASSGASFEGSNCKGTPSGGQCGLYKSVDSGLTWTQLGLQSPGTDSLSIDPVSGALYAGGVLTNSTGTVFKSTDGGTTWTPLKNGFSARGPYVRVDPASPTTVYAFYHLGFGTESDTYARSTDAGVTWTTMAAPHLCSLNTPKSSCLNPPRVPIYDLILVPPPSAGTSGTPTIAAGGVVSGAAFLPGISPNTWASILGTNLAATSDDWSKFIVNGQFPTTLDGVSVTIGGKGAYMYYVTPTQLNFLVPDVGIGPMQVTVTTGAGTSAAVTANSTLYSPAFFLWPNNQAVATQQNYSLAAKDGTFPGFPTVPAKPGDVLILWGTGFGPTNPVPPSGTAVPGDTTYSAAVLPTVTVNNLPATVYGAALAPGFAGLFQVAIQVPAALADGDWPIQANVAGVSSPGGVILSVHR